MDKFAGIGLKQAFVLWLLFTLFDVMAKVVFTKYHVKGVSEIIQAK